MPHIHELIDFVVMIYVINQERVLLVNHKKLKAWLPLGGHIELDEDPETAVYREAKEESGLDIDLVGQRPPLQYEGVKALVPPDYLDIHTVSDTHRHIGLIYIARSHSDQVQLAANEHKEIQWFAAADLEKKEYNIGPSVRYYAQQAFKKAAKND